MLIRPAEDADGPACVAGLRAVFEADAYPKRWPDDPDHFLRPTGTLGRWVAVDGDQVTGHIVLRDASGHQDTAPIAAATGLDPAGLAQVARLWVAPAGRGRGLGADLLAAAGAEARRRRLRPVLDVLSDGAPAIALYERLGWTRVGSRPVTFGDGSEWTILYYVSPTV